MECRFTLKLVRDLIITYSKEIIQSILMKENITLFSNVKVIIHLNCIACVKVPIESVVKSLVLRYEKGLILPGSLLYNILRTKWSLLRTDLSCIIMMKY